MGSERKMAAGKKVKGTEVEDNRKRRSKFIYRNRISYRAFSISRLVTGHLAFRD